MRFVLGFLTGVAALIYLGSLVSRRQQEAYQRDDTEKKFHGFIHQRDNVYSRTYH